MSETIVERARRKYEEGRRDALAGRPPRDTETAYIKGYESEYDLSRVTGEEVGE